LRHRAKRRGSWSFSQAAVRCCRTARLRICPICCELGIASSSMTAASLRRDSEPAIEATLHKRLDGSRWRAFVKPAKKLAVGDVLRFGTEGKVCFLGQ